MKRRSVWTGMSKAARSAEMKRRRKVAERNKKTSITRHPTTKDTTHEARHDQEVVYAFGYCRAWLDTYADRTGLARSALAGRVGELLHHAAGR